MAVVQLIYVSRRTEKLDDAAMEAVVEHSASRNAARGITGMLLVSGAHVMQLLEGEETTITPLFERIAQDPRHADVRRLIQKETRRRLCPDWGMRLVRPREDARLDAARLERMINDIRASLDTAGLTVEARVLLSDFRQQLEAAPAGGSKAERVRWIA